MPAQAPAERIAAVRAFNRFWTNRIGALRAGLFDTPYTLAEARVIYELAQADGMEVSDLRRALDMDPGYLSRLLARLEKRGLLTRERKGADARRRQAGLTRKGRGAFRTLDQRSAREAARLLEQVGEREQARLVGAMDAIRRMLGEGGESEAGFVLRAPQPGDLGWIVHAHGALYAEEFGWDERFETLVARVVAEYAEKHEPGRDGAWIAELDGEPAGCVLCVERSKRVAQLRLLLVEPRARGRGIGARLVEECARFARRAGYRELTLWTNHPLEAARRIYDAAGFELVDEQPHESFGHDLVGQTLRLRLDRGGPRT